MKKILIATNLITLAATVYLLVKSNKPIEMKPPPISNVISEGCNLRKIYTNIPVPGLISVQFAQMISKDYASDSGKKYITRENVITKDTDALCLNFDIEKIKKYIWKIEERFCGKNCDNLQLGIRFYYAKYPDATICGLNGIDPKYAMRHALFMVPTYFNGQRHVDFDPLDSLSLGLGDACKPTPLSQLIKIPAYLNSNKPVGIMAITDGDVDNHGGLMPPPAGAGTFPSDY